MQKVKRKINVTYSDTPPPGWPTEAQWKEAEARLENTLATRIIPFRDMTTLQKLKQSICAQFVKHIKKNKIKQKDLAETLGITESRMSEILHYHFDNYTVDRLLTLLIIIKPEAKFELIA
jgi:predicted XRE-type DNA-binding protein